MRRPVIQSFSSFVQGNLAAVPGAWRDRVKGQFAKQVLEARSIPGGTGKRSDAERNANLWLSAVAERMRGIKVPLNLSDAELCALARDCAEKCLELANRPLVGFSSLSELRARMADYVERFGITPPAAVVEEIDAQTGEVVTVRGIADRGAVRRMACHLWWRRRLRAAQGRAIEREAIFLGYVNKAQEIYASSATVERRAQQKARNAAALENTTATNQYGEEYTLAKLAEKAVSNPEIRRGELMTRLRGFEFIARGLGHVAEFWTATAPSRMHAKEVFGKTVKDNPKFDGTTPRQAQSYLVRAWAAFRAACARFGLSPYGFRISEPHHDATPHWHLLLFVAPWLSAGRAAVPRLRALMRRYLCRDLDKKPPQLKDAPPFLAVRLAKDRAALRQAWAAAAVHAFAWKTRQAENKDKARKRQALNCKVIDDSEGTAAGYLAKYVSKNVNGGGYQVQGDIEGKSAAAITPAQRVEAWASTWGIRQFQQIGGPPVGVWRELRRLAAAADLSPVVEAARMAADLGEWAAYIDAMGGAVVPRKLRPLGLSISPDGFRFNADKGIFEQAPQTKYEEEAKGAVYGVLEKAAGRDYVTRIYQWEISRSESASDVGGERLPNRANPFAGNGMEKFGRLIPKSEQETRQEIAASLAFDLAQLVAPWTRVNNCTDMEKKPDGKTIKTRRRPGSRGAEKMGRGTASCASDGRGVHIASSGRNRGTSAGRAGCR